MKKLTIELNEGQWDALSSHAKEKKRSPEDDLVAVWWGRTNALLNYAAKLGSKDAQFRAYAPKLFPAAEREKLKKLALATGIAPAPSKRESKVKKVKALKKVKAAKAVKAPPAKKKAVAVPEIKSTDSVEVAMKKAEIISDSDPVLTFAQVMRANGRDANGRLLK